MRGYISEDDYRDFNASLDNPPQTPPSGAMLANQVLVSPSFDRFTLALFKRIADDSGEVAFDRKYRHRLSEDEHGLDFPRTCK